MGKHPDNEIIRENHVSSKETIVCLPYDIYEIYAFYCSRYTDIKYKDFLNLGYEEFSIKLNSIPENEPLYKVFKSRAININSIKDKEEKKYWKELKRVNKIPDIYLPTQEINRNIKDILKERGIKDVK